MKTLNRVGLATGVAFALAVPVMVAAPAVSAPENPINYRGTVTSVIDGDSLRVRLNGEESSIEVRLIGVDAPAGGCATRASTGFATTRLLDERVRLRIDRKRDESDTRLFAYVYVDGKLFNLESIKAGFSQVRTYGEFGVDQQFKSRFQAAEDQAEAADLGLWDDGSFRSVR